MNNLPIDVHKFRVHNNELLVLSTQIQWELLIQFLVNLALILSFILIFVGIVNLIHPIKIMKLENFTDSLLLGPLDSKVC